jgi:hypothetical protein
MAKLNCWEFEKCGREPGGKLAEEMGICPAATNGNRNNGGVHAGRVCLAIAGTYCKGKVQGRFAQKLPECMQCDFYTLVKEEEGADFSLK